MSRNCADDIRKISQAMDVLAKLVLEKRQEDGSLQLEYKKKLNELDKCIRMIVGITGNEYSIDRNYIDRVLGSGVEIIERQDSRTQELRKFALIPIVESTTKPKKKKKNRIPCSFCHEVGHTRAKCEAKLMYTPKDS